MKEADSILSSTIQAYLKACGMSAKSIAQCSKYTSLWHDLGIYGEVADIHLEVLSEKFHVDLNEFEFAEYFPEETQTNNIFLGVLVQFIPLLGHLMRKRGQYAPLSLGMIEDAIISKKLV